MNWEKYGIDISKVRSGKAFCPKCHHERRKQQDRELSVDLERGLFNCHHCSFSGSVVEYKRKREYTPPQPRLQKVSDKVLKFFESRGINNNTLLRFGITESKEWMPQYEKEVDTICFNYFRNEQLVNIKFRGPEKSFKLSKDSELIFFNLDAITGSNLAVICEGEIDCLSFHEAGIYPVISVPNGASKGNQNLEYLDNCWQHFEGVEKIVLATDNDEPGISLRDELARRLGKGKCLIVDYPKDCKDANDVLLKYGKQALATIVEQARIYPIEGIMPMDDIFPVVDDWFENGYPEGTKAGIRGFDEFMRFETGVVTTITGIPGHGKDEFLNWVMVKLAINAGWKFGVCGFEETPSKTVTKLAEKITGKSFDFRKNTEHRMSRMEYENAIAIIDNCFHFYNCQIIETTVDEILSIAERLVKHYGIKGLYLNPWSWIEQTRLKGQSETDYVSEVYSRLIRFAAKFNLHIFLVAHTTKMQKDKQTGKYSVPTLYDISGSAHFFGKTHYGLTVYREYDTGIVTVYFQKIKQSWMGKQGWSSYQFNTFTRQYEYRESSEGI